MSRVQQADGHQLINSFESFFFDADGVLWLGDTPLPGAVDFLQHLISSGLYFQLSLFNSFRFKSVVEKEVQNFGILCF